MMKMQFPYNARDRRGWPTVLVLSASQALSQSGQTMVMTVTALTGAYLSDMPALATLPLALQFLGMMIATIPASLLMKRLGRRAGFSLGQAIGAAAALVAAYGILQGSFWLFAAGSMGIGAHNAFWQHLRFAATEAVSENKRARAVSYVLLGGVVAALVGPWLAAHTREYFAPILFAGCYVALAGLSGVNILLLQTARFEAPDAGAQAGSGRPLREIARQPAFVMAVVSAAGGYGAMIFVMTATPLAMAGCGLGFGDMAFVIQWHVLGMYVPSFCTGRVIDRIGAERTIGIGILLIVIAMSANLSGLVLENFWVGLVAVGVGWNFMFISGTTLLTHTYRPEERAKVQALNEFVVFGTVSAASLSSGALFAAFGWTAVNAALALPLLLILAVLSRSMLRRRVAVKLAAN